MREQNSVYISTHKYIYVYTYAPNAVTRSQNAFITLPTIIKSNNYNKTN